ICSSRTGVPPTSAIRPGNSMGCSTRSTCPTGISIDCWKGPNDENCHNSCAIGARLPSRQIGDGHMKLSARNLLKGTITEVKKGQTTAHVRIDVGGTVVTASITNEAVDDLKLQKGQQAYAVIKASDVMVAID